MNVCKILTPDQWNDIQGQVHFPGTPLDQADGFIHLSTPEQVAGTLQRFYADTPAVIVLTIDCDLLGDGLKLEEAHGQRFPHFYGALPLSAVIRAEERQRGTGWPS